VRVGGYEMVGGRFESRWGVDVMAPSDHNPQDLANDVALILLNKPVNLPTVGLAPSECAHPHRT